MKNWTKSAEGQGMLGRVVRAVCGLTGMLMLAAAPCLGQGPTPPDVLPYQGTLVNGDGDPLGSPTPKNYDVIFRIYDASTDGNLVWSEQQTATVDGGRFSLQLGLGGQVGTEPRPSLSTVFRSMTASDRFIETTVKGIGPSGADSTLSPRIRLLPGAFSMVARHALTAERLVNATGSNVLTVVGGRVGINTTNPTSSLQITGSLRARSLSIAGNATVGDATAGTWTGAGAAPVGAVILWSGTAVDKPTGWALCDGSVVNGVRTPDLRGRFVLGAGDGPGLTSRRVNDRGGTEVQVLGEAELPQHVHVVDPPADTTWDGGEHRHSFSGEANNDFRNVGAPYVNYDLHGYYSGSWKWIKPFAASDGRISNARYTLTTTSDGAHSHAMDISAVDSWQAGSGAGHANMPPFYVLAYIVRVQ